MSRVGTGGWKTGHPYAVNYDNSNTIAHLGTPIILGLRSKWPVDMAQAQAEAVPVRSHDGLSRVLEYLTLASMSNEISGDAFNSIAIAALASNGLMPKEIQHTHPEIWSKKIVIADFVTQIDHGLGEASLFIDKHQDLFDDHSYEYELALLRLSRMYSLGGQNVLPRQFRVIDSELIKKE